MHPLTDSSTIWLEQNKPESSFQRTYAGRLTFFTLFEISADMSTQTFVYLNKTFVIIRVKARLKTYVVWTCDLYNG